MYLFVYVCCLIQIKYSLNKKKKKRCFEFRRMFACRCTRYKKNLRDKEYRKKNILAKDICLQISYELLKLVKRNQHGINQFPKHFFKSVIFYCPRYYGPMLDAYNQPLLTL